MKKIIKKSYLLAAVLLATIVSCNSDDDTSATPINIENLEVTIDENPTNGQVIGTVQSNSNDALTYNITTQTPAGALSINAATGELLVADASFFDYEVNPTITATISVLEATNSGTVTINLNDLNEVGEYKFGGVIFWVNLLGNEGYSVAMDNQSAAAPYGCLHTATGATATAIGTGQANTNAILSICTTSGTAADLVDNLNTNGYDDWFLPSQDEMREIMNNMIIINTTLTNNGGAAFSVANANYWTSTESTAAEARVYNFTNDWFPTDYKSNLHPVRAVRAWSDF